MKEASAATHAVMNAASAEAKMSAAQPSRKAPPPPVTDLAATEDQRDEEDKEERPQILRRAARCTELLPDEKAQAGQVSLCRNQDHPSLLGLG